MQIDHLDYQWAKTQGPKDVGKMATDIHSSLHQAFQRIYLGLQMPLMPVSIIHTIISLLCAIQQT